MTAPIRDTGNPPTNTPGGNNLNKVSEKDSGKIAPEKGDAQKHQEDLEHPDGAGNFPSPL